MRKLATVHAFNPFPQLWQEHREASRNWLALGIMLAAWNLVSDDAESVAARPEPLRRYDCVSVRALQRLGADSPAPSAGHKTVNTL